MLLKNKEKKLKVVQYLNNRAFEVSLLDAFIEDTGNFGANALSKTLQQFTDKGFPPERFDDATYDIIFECLNQIQEGYYIENADLPPDFAKEYNRENLQYIYSHSFESNALGQERKNDLILKSEQILEAYRDNGLAAMDKAWDNIAGLKERSAVIKPFMDITEMFFDEPLNYRFVYEPDDKYAISGDEESDEYIFNLAANLDNLLASYALELQMHQSEIDGMQEYETANNWHLFETLDTTDLRELLGNPIMQDGYFLFDNLLKGVRTYLQKVEKSSLHQTLVNDYGIKNERKRFGHFCNSVKAVKNAGKARSDFNITDMVKLYNKAAFAVANRELDIVEVVDELKPIYRMLGAKSFIRGDDVAYQQFNPIRFAEQKKSADLIAESLSNNEKYQKIKDAFLNPRFNDSYYFEDLCTKKDGLFDILHNALVQGRIAEGDKPKISLCGAKEFKGNSRLSDNTISIYPDYIDDFYDTINTVVHEYYHLHQGKENSPLLRASDLYKPRSLGKGITGVFEHDGVLLEMDARNYANLLTGSLIALDNRKENGL